MNKNPRIGLISVYSFFRPGGVKNHILALQKEFQKRGIESKAIIPRYSISEKYDENIVFLGKTIFVPFFGVRFDFSFCPNSRKIDKFLERGGFDILHFHNFGLLSYQILKRSKALNILTFHADIKGERAFKIFPFLIPALKKVVKEKIDGIIGTAPFVLDVFGNFTGPTTVIPNGIDLNQFNPGNPKIKKYLDGKFNILFLGRIEKRKGLIYLLRAYEILQKKFDNLRLIVIGKGPLKNECQNYVNSNKLKDVIFEGEIENEKTPPYYTTADIYVSPAFYGESFGIVLLEAMASGCPVVAFANRGYQRVLSGKGAEFLAKPQDWQELAQKMEILIRDEAKRKEMREWGIAEAQKYSWPKIADQVLDFYQLCLEKKNKKSTSF